MTTALAAALDTTAAHNVRPVNRSMSNLSDFACSCGQQFISNELLSIPHDAPTMSAVHRAEALLTVLDVADPQRRVTTLIELGRLDLAAGTIIRDAGGVMLQRPKWSELWLSQAGQRREDHEVALPATVVWMPGD